MPAAWLLQRLTVRLSPVAVAIDDSPAFADLITGILAACGRTSAGRVFCWGINAYGEMGITPSGLTTRYTHFSADGDGSALVHDRQAFTARFAA